MMKWLGIFLSLFSLISSFKLESTFDFESKNFPNHLASSYNTDSVKLSPSETIEQYILKELKLPFERHYVTTSDGYIMEVHRIPQPNKDNAPPLIMQHGILASSWCWLISEDLPSVVKFHEEGYDLWLTNSRGNIYSLNHTTLTLTSDEFWDFTFGDMKHDVSANIKYVLEATNQRKVNYMGWSQGTTSFFIAGQSQEYSQFIHASVRHFIALSPVTYLKHQKSEFFKVCVKYHLGVILRLFKKSFLEGSTGLHELEDILCKVTFGELCTLTASVFCGPSVFDRAENIERFAEHFPSGTSTKDLLHYDQFIISGRFAAFDYGAEENMKKYGQKTSPVFELDKFHVPTSLFFAELDDLVAKEDAQRLLAELPASTVQHNIVFENFSHITWMVSYSNPTTDAWLVKATKIFNSKQH